MARGKRLALESLEPRYLLSGLPTLIDIFEGAGESAPGFFTNVNGTLFFSADTGTNGRELWKSDGTAGGTTLVKDTQAGINGSNPQDLTNVNGTLFFSTNDGTSVSGLWKSNGTDLGTELVKDIYPYPSGGSAGILGNVGTRVYLVADDNDCRGTVHRDTVYHNADGVSMHSESP